jgi:hypothetical protein
MTIKINEVSEDQNLILKFVPSGILGMRLWIQDPKSNYKSVGFCPHQNINNDECSDCSLVLEG